MLLLRCLPEWLVACNGVFVEEILHELRGQTG